MPTNHVSVCHKSVYLLYVSVLHTAILVVKVITERLHCM